MKVLDLGCGDGTTAMPAARLGARRAGRRHRPQPGRGGEPARQGAGPRQLRFQEGDATDLRELADSSFDLVVSIFGAMFAPKPFDVAKEMVRVTRPGGRIVMGNWIPNDPTLVAQILKISSAYSPPPPEGFISPMTWGVESQRHRAVRGAPASAQEKISFVRDTYTFKFPGTPAEFVDAFRQLLRPDHERLRGGGEERAGRRSAEGAGGAVRRARTRARSKDATSIPATFLRVTVAVG